jgi:hypothetical protein
VEAGLDGGGSTALGRGKAFTVRREMMEVGFDGVVRHAARFDANALSLNARYTVFRGASVSRRTPESAVKPPLRRGELAIEFKTAAKKQSLRNVSSSVSPD